MQAFKFKNKMQIILQGEAAECGLVALLMLMNYYDLNTDLFTIRKSYLTSLKGLTLFDLKAIAEKFNFKVTVVRFEIHQLRTLRLPCILHWERNHFVVLTKITKKSIIIHDPAIGKRKIPLATANAAITGIAFEIQPNSNFKPVNLINKIHIGRLTKRLPIKKFITKLFFLSLCLQVFSLIAPQYIQRIIDGLQLQFTSKYFIILAIFFIGIKMIELGITTTRAIFIEKLNSTFNYHLGWVLFRHLVRLPMQFFEKRTAGDLIAKFALIDKIILILAKGMIEGIIDVLFSVTLFVIIWIYDLKMAMLVTMVCFIYAVIKYLKSKFNREINDKLIKLNSAHHGYLIETLKGIQPIKIYLKQKQRTAIWRAKYIQYLEANNHCAAMDNYFLQFKNFITGVELILIILIAAFQVIEKQLSIGMLYAFLFYRSLLVNSFTNFIDNLYYYQLIKVYLGQLADVMLQPKEKIRISNYHQKNQITKVTQLSAENVSFKYGENEVTIFNNISFAINHNESVVIVAPSGKGKTTLLKILMGLIEPSVGTIKLNNIPLNQICKTFYRNKIAAVMQDDQLFYGNIYENIAFFDKEILQEKVIKVCQFACIHDEIMRMPMQYYSLVGDMGTVLSGGQKQRILLARALYREPEILFLDEATSHLDLANESEINSNLKSLNIMRIMIAHRKETIETADRIIHLT